MLLFPGIACDLGVSHRWAEVCIVWALVAFVFGGSLFYNAHTKNLARRPVGWVVPLSIGLLHSTKFLLALVHHRFQSDGSAIASFFSLILLSLLTVQHVYLQVSKLKPFSVSFRVIMSPSCTVLNCLTIMALIRAPN